MLFNSFEFIFIFLPISFIIYFFLIRKRLIIASKGWLVFSSLFFYSWWNVIYLPLILTSILFNYIISNSIIDTNNKNRPISKKALLLVGLIFNIGLLVYFKYMDFFIINTNYILGSQLDLFHLALPLAISFFTLQQIAFLVDSYEGLVKEKNFLDYTIFVSFFPQLIAGPIVHHSEMMPQFSSVKNKVINLRNIATGIFIFSIGLFKKVVIADTFAKWATAGFSNADSLNLVAAWASSLSYTFQLYFDFSGYTDMAIGAALLFNIKIPQNFNSPYRSLSIIEFWQRWHITLSNFITTYIYTPLIRSFERITFHKAMFATFLTMFIAGLWHGAAWTFVIFGTLHGVGLVINHYWRKRKVKINAFLSWFITFNYVNITFVFFRANSVSEALEVLKGMFGLHTIYLPEKYFSFLSEYQNNIFKLQPIYTQISGNSKTTLMLITAFVVVLFLKNTQELSQKFSTTILYLLYSSILFMVSISSMSRVSEFLYFNF